MMNVKDNIKQFNFNVTHKNPSAYFNQTVKYEIPNSK